jgi:hypothetical protein
MLAVEMNHEGLVFFTPVELPEPLRREIIDENVGQIRDDVEVIHPGGDEYRPTYVLCVSRSDPSHYEFLDRCEVDPTRLRIVDTAFRVVESVEGWWKFLGLIAETRAMMASITGVEASDDWPEGIL